jgi:hypothetical protein
MDFSLERARLMMPNSEDLKYLLEISWLYNRIVESGSQVPVIDLAYELVLSEEFIAECVRNAMEAKLLTHPKRGSFGGVITLKALRMLRQAGKHVQ